MDISLTTPALLFPAVSLILLAYTNRFLSLAALVRHLCLRAGMAEELIDVSGLWGAVEGYVISALEAPRASISTLARHFGFDAT